MTEAGADFAKHINLIHSFFDNYEEYFVFIKINLDTLRVETDKLVEPLNIIFGDRSKINKTIVGWKDIKSVFLKLIIEWAEMKMTEETVKAFELGTYLVYLILKYLVIHVKLDDSSIELEKASFDFPNSEI